MAVKFKNAPDAGEPDTTKTFAFLQEKVRTAFGLPDEVEIHTGLTRTSLHCNGVRVDLPFGIPDIKGGNSLRMHLARKTLVQLTHSAGIEYAALPKHSPESEALGGVPIPAQSDDPDTMTDSQWIVHVASQLFPGTIHLHKASDLYQPVLGTSSGSIYKTCFIGPHLKIAARLKKESVSFRATTNHNTAPEGDLADILKRLGLASSGEDRMTGHAAMTGPYTDEYAFEYRALFGAYYAALKPWITSNFPAIGKLSEGVK